jgi:hypothetical protein
MPNTATWAISGWVKRYFSISAGINVLAAADDHFLEAPDDAQIAVAVHRAQINRVQPVGSIDRLSRRVRIGELPAHQVVASETHLAQRQRGAGLRIDDFDLLVWHVGADRPESKGPPGRGADQPTSTP